MDYIDISPVIHSGMAVFPGDTPFSRQIALDFNFGDNLLLSQMTTTLHIGAHTDAPNHYHADGCGIDKRDLDFYLGACQVVTVPKLGAPYRLQLTDIEKINIQAPRLLFKTNSFPDPNHWNNDFTAFSVEVIHYLANQGVKLIGIDTPSVDPADDTVLEAHNAIMQHDLAILEGIVLSQVSDGLYDLIALPLALLDADASPVRAILLPHKTIKE